MAESPVPPERAALRAEDFETLLGQLDVLAKRLSHEDPVGPGAQWLLATTAIDAFNLTFKLRAKCR